jgi:hypothetical protein
MRDSVNVGVKSVGTIPLFMSYDIETECRVRGKMPESRFRQYAADCMARAQRATSASARVVWLNMAQRWMKSAERPSESPAGQLQQPVQPQSDDGKPAA